MPQSLLVVFENKEKRLTFLGPLYMHRIDKKWTSIDYDHVFF